MIRKQCGVCKKEFNARNDGIKFCSLACGYIGRKVYSNQIKSKCSNCGKEFSRSPSLLAGYKRVYCSKKCQNVHYKKIFNGAKNPNWRGGTTTQRISTYKGPGNKLFKKGKRYEYKARKELEQDGYYIIQSAGSKGLWDLVAINKDGIKLVQVKANNLPIPKDRIEMGKFVCPENASKEIWRYYGSGKKEIYIYKDTWRIRYEKTKT